MLNMPNSVIKASQLLVCRGCSKRVQGCRPAVVRRAKEQLAFQKPGDSRSSIPAGRKVHFYAFGGGNPRFQVHHTDNTFAEQRPFSDIIQFEIQLIKCCELKRKAGSLTVTWPELLLLA